MNGCCRMIGQEHDAALAYLAADALPQTAGVNQDKAARARRTFTPLPCLAEECLSLEILVEFVAELHLYVTQYALKYGACLLIKVAHRIPDFRGCRP